ncbi:MAG: hypothetical protein JWP00_462, partial [Chloroflexi bacterium]|nr:hypothetical protein [Chloroflexota bacterium]
MSNTQSQPTLSEGHATNEQTNLNNYRRFEILVNNSSDVISVHSPDGTFLYVSPSCRSIFGYDPEELLGKAASEYLPTRELSKNRKNYSEIIKSANGKTFTFRFLHKSGQFFWIDTRIQPILDPITGEIVEYLCTSGDAAKHRSAEEGLKKSEKQYRTLARIIPNSIVYMFDRNLRFILAEGTILNSSKGVYSKQSLEGKTIWEVFPRDYAEHLELIYRKTLNGHETIEEKSYNGRNYLIQVFPVKDDNGQVYAGLILSQDITDRKQVEAQLKASEVNYQELYLTANRQAQELTLLHKVRNTLSKETDLDLLMKSVVEETSQEFGYSQVALFLRQGDNLLLQHQVGYTDHLASIPINKGVNGRVALKGNPEFVVDVTKDPDFIEGQVKIVAQICIPLFDQHQVIGTLNVESTIKDQLSHKDLGFLEVLGKYVSLAIQRSRLDNQLRQNQERLQTVIRNAPVGLYTFDTEGIFSMLEGKGLAALGFSPGELVGKSIFNVFEKNHDLVKAVRRALAGETFNTIVEEGGVVFDSYLSPVKNEKGEVTSVIGVSTNITEKRQIEKALQAERDFALQVMENMGQGLVVFKPDFTIEFGNSAFAKMGKYTLDELIGKTPFDLVPKNINPLIAVLTQNMFDQPGTSFETNLMRKDGTFFDAQVSLEPIYLDGELARIVGVVSDLTEHKKVEQQLRLALEKEKELGEMKNRLITTASHEFRTPLSSIISSTELLEHYSHRWSEEKKREILNRISQSANKLTGLIEDILIYNRSEEGKLEPKRARLNLSEFCNDLVNTFQISASDSKTVRLVEIGVKQETYLDEKLLSYTLTNLLSNGVKYSLPGGLVTLELEWKAGEVIFRVKDNGIGIPLKDQTSLFKPFQRASNVSMINGTGFGLAIVKHSVLAMSGRVQLESIENQGTAITVTLPLESNGSDANQFEMTPEGDTKNGPDSDKKLENITENWWLLEQAIEASSSGFIISDPRQADNPIIYASKGFERLTGFLREEVLGKNVRFLEGADWDQPALMELRKAVLEERECRVILRNYHKDGHLLWIELQLSPVRNSAGKLLYFVGIQNDVTDRIKAQVALNQSEQEFKALVENSPDVIARFDRNARCLYVNAALERISRGRVTVEQITGKNFSEQDLTEYGMSDFEVEIKKVLDSGTRSSVEINSNIVGNENRYFQVQFIPEFSLDGKEVVSVFTIGRDITD